MGKKVAQSEPLKAQQQELLPAFLKARSSTSCSLSVHAKPGAKVNKLSLSVPDPELTLNSVTLWSPVSLYCLACRRVGWF